MRLTRLENVVESGPTVSVVIPTYNREKMLAEAIDSVLRQGYPDFELIVVDDGSTDRTQAFLSGYGEAISVIRQENRGVSAARNHGIRQARGELIAFLDSDDLWMPEKLSVQVRFFRTHPNAVVCQTEEIWMRNGVRVNPKKRHEKPSGDIFERSLALCLVSPSAVMVKKSLFDEVGFFNENLPACEDYDLWLRIGCRYPVHLIDMPLIVKRGGHADQLSKMEKLDKYRIQSIVELMQSGVMSSTQRQAAFAMLKKKIEVYAGGCEKRGRHEEAARLMGLMEEVTGSR